LVRASAALLYSRTKSAIAIGQFFSPPLHCKATINNSSHHKRTEIIICNTRAKFHLSKSMRTIIHPTEAATAKSAICIGLLFGPLLHRKSNNQKLVAS
jgi:hypothetical protein